MAEFLSTVLLIVVVFLATNSEAAEHYEIMKTWDNRTINHPPIKIELDRLDFFSFQIKFEGPLFKDPVNPPGLPNEPFYGLWEYEVAEVFFLNDAGQYVEIEVAPYGQYIVLLLNGYRNTIRHSLLIDVSTNRSSNTWEGTAIVPVHYLPPNVTKMNAYAIHGSGDNRTYEALYPVRFNSTLNPDFHNLEAFKAFDRSIILMEDVNTAFSTIWTDSLDGVRSFTIKSRWNGSPLPTSDNIQLYIDNNANESLSLWIEAPFYNDPAPPVTPGPIDSFIDFEVVHLFLLNQNNLYLQISIGPYGHYKISLMPYCESGSDPKKYPLSVTTFRRSGKWAAIATIPLTYLPPTVTKSNAGSAHGTGQARKFNSLYPMPPDTEFLEPNYGLLQYYKALDFEMIFPTNKDGSYSTFWNEVVNTGACLNSAAARFNISSPFISMIILTTIIWNDFLVMKLL